MREVSKICESHRLGISHHEPKNSTYLFERFMKGFKAPINIVNYDKFTSGCLFELFPLWQI